MSINSQKGSAPILLLLAALGLLVFLFITNTFSFKDRLFNTLYPKPPSHAEETIPPSVPDEILVKFKPGVNDKVKDNIRSAHGLTKKDEIQQIGVERDNVPEKAKDKIIEALKKNPRVEYAEPNILAELQDVPNDPLFTTDQWALQKVAASSAWDISKGNSSLSVAVLDSGVYSNHEDLVGKILPGYNYLDNNTDTSDVHGHGTLVAGTAGAVTNNTKGVASLGHDISIMPFVVCNSRGSCDLWAASQGIIYAADHGAKAANMSFGGSGGCPSYMQDAINYAFGKGVLSVAAAGNYGQQGILEPAICNNVIAVSGTDGDDKWSNNNYGPGLDVMAPQCSYTTTKAGGYGQVCGTSFASPMTAALAGLIMSANPGLTNQQVVDIITQTADKVDASTYGGYDANGWNDHFGFGRINATAALQKAVGLPVNPPDTVNPTVTITNPTAGSTISGVIDFTANVTDNVGVVKVEFHYNCTHGTDVVLATDTSAPYLASWDTTKCPNNNSTYIYAKAYDAAGNTNNINDSVVSSITVNNSSSPDTTAPTASVSSPANGSTISGNTNIQASASDNVGLSTISIFVDGNVATSCSVSGISSNCSYSLDTTQYSSGSHTIYASALDSSNNLGQSSSITVNVNNVTSTPTPSPIPSPTPVSTPAPSDTTKPTVSITNPTDGGTVKTASKVNITASASDNVGISKVEFWVGTSLKCISTLTAAGPYACTWSVPGKKNSSYTIQVKAYDSSNNSQSVSIKVIAQ